MTVLVSVRVDVHASPSMLREAVDSVLGQTHADLVCLVVADGVPDPDGLDDITDPRLVFYGLPHDRGTYYVDKVAAGAAAQHGWWWTPQDQHDIADADRLAALLAAADTDTDAVLAGHVDIDGMVRLPELPPSTPRLTDVAHRAGLWRAATTAQIIAHGYRAGYDPVQTTAAAAFGTATLIEHAGYQVRTVDPSMTGPYQAVIAAQLRAFWSQRVMPVRVGLDLAGFGGLVTAYLPQELDWEVAHHTAALVDLLHQAAES